MNDESQWISKRRHPRISWGFIVKSKPKNQPGAEWEVTTIKDISQGGCFFHTNTAYKSGQLLDIIIHFPGLEPMHFTGEVRRFEPNIGKAPHLYGVGVQFLEMDQARKNEFANTLAFFLKKQAKPPGKD